MRSSAFVNYAVNFKATVGANGGTRCTSDAGIGLCGIGKVIATVINLLGLQFKNVTRAGYDTKAAPLATLAVDFDRSIDFCHRII